MRYWGCANYSSEYPDRCLDIATYRQPSPEPLCGYHNWIDLEIHPEDQWALDFEEWNVARSSEIREEERRKNDQTLRMQRETKAHLEACTRREQEARERKREMASKTKEAANEFNAELARKGKWSRSTQ